jgi:ABC-type enterobactin transport system permease subunit
VSPYRLVLVGIGVQAILSSAITFVLVRAPE